MKLREAQRLDTLGMAYDVDVQALAAINRVESNATLDAGTRLLLPGRSDVAASVALFEPSPETAIAVSVASTACTVRAGDTLWDIARRYRVRIEDLMQWNRLSRSSPLRLGQKLVLAEPMRNDSGH
ncbi:MAG: LysM peptidoglycan-binding domain-containing protein [Gammaproteobacteria bacterium]|nr:MAG: LysM peptidoglycan-binding domain-containing protein [Gammaproteobacteria bacterium]